MIRAGGYADILVMAARMAKQKLSVEEEIRAVEEREKAAQVELKVVEEEELESADLQPGRASGLAKRKEAARRTLDAGWPLVLSSQGDTPYAPRGRGQIGEDLEKSKLATLLKKTTAVTSVEIDNAAITAQGLEELIKAVVDQPLVVNLCCRSNAAAIGGDTSVGACGIVERTLSRPGQGMRSLDLTKNDIRAGSKFALTLAEQLRSHTALTELALGNNPIGNAAAEGERHLPIRRFADHFPLFLSLSSQQLETPLCHLNATRCAAIASAVKGNPDSRLVRLGNFASCAQRQLVVAELCRRDDIRLVTDTVVWCSGPVGTSIVLYKR